MPMLKNTEHFVFVDITQPLQNLEDGRDIPGAPGNDSPARFGYDAGNVIEETAACNVDQSTNRKAFQ